MLCVCESSVCVLFPLSNFLTQDKKTFPSPSASHLSVLLVTSLPSFFLGLLTIWCQTVYHSCLFCPSKNVSSNKPAPRMDFAIHCRKALWLLFQKKNSFGNQFTSAPFACVCSKTSRGVKIVADYQLNRCLVFLTLVMSQKECGVLT